MQNTEMDQHFLIDKEILKTVVKTADVKKNEKVIEIGCGSGILTKEIYSKSKEYLGFEIDKRYKEELSKYLYSNSKIIFDSALKYSWIGYDKVVSNLPYGLSEPVIYKAIDEYILELTLMVGKNFKELLLDEKNKISIIANLYYNIKPIKEVSKEAFEPKPRVKSWIINLKSKEANKVERILKFAIKRKGKIKNAILYGLVQEDFTKKESRALIEKMNFPEEILGSPTKRITGDFLIKLKENLNKLLE